VSNQEAVKSGLMVELQSSQSRVMSLAQETEMLRDRLLAEDAERARVQAAATAAQTELHMTKVGVSELAKENEALRQQLRDAQSRATAEMAAKTSALKELTTTQSELKGTAKAREEIAHRLTAVEGDLSSATNVAKALQGELSIVSNVCDQTKANLTEAEEAIKRAQLAKAGVDMKLSETEQKAAALHAEGRKKAQMLMDAEQRAAQEAAAARARAGERDVAVQQVEAVKKEHLEKLERHMAQQAAHHWTQTQRRSPGNPGGDVFQRSLFRSAFSALTNEPERKARALLRSHNLPLQPPSPGHDPRVYYGTPDLFLHGGSSHRLISDNEYATTQAYQPTSLTQELRQVNQTITNDRATGRSGPAADQAKKDASASRVGSASRMGAPHNPYAANPYDNMQQGAAGYGGNPMMPEQMAYMGHHMGAGPGMMHPGMASQVMAGRFSSWR